MAAGSGLGNGYLSGLKVSSQKPDSMHTFVHKEFLNGLKKESLVMLQEELETDLNFEGKSRSDHKDKSRNVFWNRNK